MKKIYLSLALCLGMVTLSGCFSSSRSNVTVHESTSISKGQELTDLQKAFKEGAVTEREYETVRTILLKRDY
jgi:Zn-dependent membrane protease YugP